MLMTRLLINLRESGGSDTDLSMDSGGVSMDFKRVVDGDLYELSGLKLGHLVDNSERIRTSDSQH